MVGAVLTDTVPSSLTERVEGRVKAGRDPKVLVQLLPPTPPLVNKKTALTVPSAYGERVH